MASKRHKVRAAWASLALNPAIHRMLSKYDMMVRVPVRSHVRHSRAMIRSTEIRPCHGMHHAWERKPDVGDGIASGAASPLPSPGEDNPIPRWRLSRDCISERDG